LYCVRSGTLKRFWRLGSGEEVVVGVRGPGDFAGLRGVLGALPYSSTAMTLSPAVVCAIPSDGFLGLVRDNTEMAYRLLMRLTHESRQLERQLIERTHDRVRKRTARFLLQWIQGWPAMDAHRIPDLSMSRVEMAQLIGTTPETLSRTLHGLADDGILAVAPREIRVLNPDALMKAAE
jgi:CRP-like cAMP-binding protein